VQSRAVACVLNTIVGEGGRRLQVGSQEMDRTGRAKARFGFLDGAAMKLMIAGVGLGLSVQAAGAPVTLSKQAPASIVKLANGDYLLDFGRVAFANLQLIPNAEDQNDITVRFGESMRDGRIDRTPPGTVRYFEVKVTLDGKPVIVAPPSNPRNTRAPAVLTPARLGVLVPFRWVEISGWHGQLSKESVLRRASFDSTWEDEAASFHSSDPMLDKVWDLCHYSIKATTFAGVFVDGDRERLAYEADAYQNQLSYFAGDASPQMPRDTFERLMQYPTWPTEWAPQMVFVAYTDWMQTGDTVWLARHYDFLKTKMLTERVGADGLVHSTAAQMAHGDIVDWPAGERDGYVFTPINTVANAFHLQAVREMHQLALALGKSDDAKDFAQRESREIDAFQKTLFDEQTGLYRDGVGTTHSSLHANLFPLAFGFVPLDKRSHVAEWLAQRGMRGSVYAAQFLLEGLFENGQATAALDEMTAAGDRSWKHMVDSGTTITWEAWDQRYKPNQDWNHAWGAAPANLLPRFVLGVQASQPGWKEVQIAPHPGNLEFANGSIPSPPGTVYISWKRSPVFTLSAQLPAGMKARILLPVVDGSHGLWKNGHPARAHRDGSWWSLDEDVAGNLSVEVR
jgi:alpha-L-rhamnosidase